MIWELEKEIRAAGKNMDVPSPASGQTRRFFGCSDGLLDGAHVRRRGENAQKHMCPSPSKRSTPAPPSSPPTRPIFIPPTKKKTNLCRLSKNDRVIVLGGGPNRIGQGIEFDYCCVHAAWAIKECGAEAIMVNCNPETVSTDYDTSDQLFFEPLTLEDVVNVVERTGAKGVIPQFGGQTPLNLAKPLVEGGVQILGTSADSIDIAEDRERFGELLKKLKIPHPANGTARNLKEAEEAAERVGYPVMVRPSYVLGGRAMEVVYDKAQLADYMRRALESGAGLPIL
jgi:hypothetical protein